MSDEKNAQTVPVIQIGGREFTVPFLELLPKQTPEKIAELEASIAADGVLYPIVINQDDVVIDGHTRLGLAVKLDITFQSIPFKVVKADFAKSEELAVTLNYNRRHMSRTDRPALVKKLRSKGWSVRRIAKSLNVSIGTVNNDIHGKPEPESPRVSGEDEKPSGPAAAGANEAAADPDSNEPLTGDPNIDWGGEGDEGPIIPGDDPAAAARSGFTAAGQLARALQRLGELTETRSRWLQDMGDVCRHHANGGEEGEAAKAA